MTSWTRERARVAALSRRVQAGERAPDDPELAAARQRLRAAKLEEHVRKVVAEAPPLSSEVCDRIAAILRAGAV